MNELRHPMTNSRAVAIIGALGALLGFSEETPSEQIITRVVDEQIALRRTADQMERLKRRLRPKVATGTGACAECGKTISANKEYCFAHLPSLELIPPSPDLWERIVSRVGEMDAELNPDRVPGTGKGIEMAEDFDAAMEPLGDAADPDVEPEPSEYAFRQALEDYPKCEPGEYSCGAAYCDDPVCTTHGGLGRDDE